MPLSLVMSESWPGVSVIQAPERKTAVIIMPVPFVTSAGCFLRHLLLSFLLALLTLLMSQESPYIPPSIPSDGWILPPRLEFVWDVLPCLWNVLCVVYPALFSNSPSFALHIKLIKYSDLDAWISTCLSHG